MFGLLLKFLNFINFFLKSRRTVFSARKSELSLFRDKKDKKLSDLSTSNYMSFLKYNCCCSNRYYCLLYYNSVPAQPNFCGHVYAIMYTEQLAANQQQDEDEKHKHNNFGIDQMTIQCDGAGKAVTKIPDFP